MSDKNFISGGISGAITDPFSQEAKKHAVQEYEAIRHRKTDTINIAQNTGFSIEQINDIKNYLFFEKHELIDGRYERFDPSFEIAQSWDRLAFDKKNIQPHDITLLKHELLEMDYISKGYTQDEAHTLTSKVYNYTIESDKFYENLKNKQHSKPKKKSKKVNKADVDLD